MRIEVKEESLISAKCDCLWGQNECLNKAAWLVKNTTNIGYAIMCEPHKEDFQETYPAASVRYFVYSPELNQQFAEAANQTVLK